MSKKQQKGGVAAAAQSMNPNNKSGQFKPLVITPQVVICLQGKYPDQWLSMELANNSATRRKVRLEPESAFGQIMLELQAKAGEIELERQLAQAKATAPTRRRVQPDWKLIAKHPQAEIRQGLTPVELTAKGSISMCPTRGAGLTGLTAEQSLEDMGL